MWLNMLPSFGIVLISLGISAVLAYGMEKLKQYFKHLSIKCSAGHKPSKNH